MKLTAYAIYRYRSFATVDCWTRTVQPKSISTCLSIRAVLIFQSMGHVSFFTRNIWWRVSILICVLDYRIVIPPLVCWSNDIISRHSTAVLAIARNCMSTWLTLIGRTKPLIVSLTAPRLQSPLTIVAWWFVRFPSSWSQRDSSAHQARHSRLILHCLSTWNGSLSILGTNSGMQIRVPVILHVSVKVFQVIRLSPLPEITGDSKFNEVGTSIDRKTVAAIDGEFLTVFVLIRIILQTRAGAQFRPKSTRIFLTSYQSSLPG